MNSLPLPGINEPKQALRARKPPFVAHGLDHEVPARRESPIGRSIADSSGGPVDLRCDFLATKRIADRDGGDFGMYRHVGHNSTDHLYYQATELLSYKIPVPRNIIRGMETSEKARLARTGDISNEAIRMRLRAARVSLGWGQEKIANDMGEGMTKQKVYNAETGGNRPSYPYMRYLFRNHRIDFNFIIHGEFAQLPEDVRERLFPALEVASNEPDPEASLDQVQAKFPPAQSQAQS